MSGKDQAPKETTQALEDIANEWWPGWRLRPNALERLRLVHTQIVQTYTKPCTRCGGTKYVKRSPRTRTFQCIRCRQIVATRRQQCPANIQTLRPSLTKV